MPYSIKNTSKPLKMESPLFIHWNTLELILLVRFHISYIKRGVTYFIINSFVDIISKAKMKYLRRRQTLEQNHDHVFLPHEYLQKR